MAILLIKLIPCLQYIIQLTVLVTKKFKTWCIFFRGNCNFGEDFNHSTSITHVKQSSDNNAVKFQIKFCKATPFKDRLFMSPSQSNLTYPENCISTIRQIKDFEIDKRRIAETPKHQKHRMNPLIVFNLKMPLTNDHTFLNSTFPKTVCLG